MLTLVDSQLHGILNSTGTAFYMATLRNPYDMTIENLVVQITLAPLFCPFTPSQISVSSINITYPGSDNTVPPGEEVLVSCTITANNAPTICTMGKSLFAEIVVPSISVQFQLVGTPPTFNSAMATFGVTP
jgi:hypothetical protein